jgi:hypothetical protein
MNTHADKIQENKSPSGATKSIGNVVSQLHNSSETAFQFIDNRPEFIAQRKLQELANNNPQAQRTAQFQAMANNHHAQQSQPIQKKPNNTGLPDDLKTGVENLSGISLDNVKVHYNSDKPAQLNAHAYAQGTDIHVAPGQEQHLPHEAWHVVQQAQGRVKPTMQMKQGIPVNDDAGLEHEADVMGAKALQMQGQNSKKLKSENLQSYVSQLFSYKVDKPIDGISMGVTIQDTGSRLLIQDTTEKEKDVGNLSGYIDYQIDKSSNELILDHFEAHPSGSGLGTLLMFELSQIALVQNYKLISVSAPALSAMGAYKVFGGKPRDPEMHEGIKGMYLTGMQVDSSIHERFVKEEATAVAESAVAKGKYFNPNMGPVSEGNLFMGALGDHKSTHSGQDDFDRVADLKALSSQLVYDPMELNHKTLESLIKRWKIL